MHLRRFLPLIFPTKLPSSTAHIERGAQAALAAFWTVAIAVGTTAGTGAAELGYRDAAQPILQRYCFDCHGAEKQKGQIRYDQIEKYRIEDGNLWAMVHEQVTTGDMPPEDKPQPSEAEKRALLSWIEQEAAAARKTVGSIRRLNRREFSAALQDVTGLAIDYADALPGDGKIAGFDTGAEALNDAADSVTQAMKVARRAVDAIRFLDPAPGSPLEANLRESKDIKKALEAWKSNGARAEPRGYPQTGIGLLLEPSWLEDRDGFKITIPPPAEGRGVMRINLLVSLMKSFPGIPDPHLWVETGGKTIDYRVVSEPLDAPAELTYEVQLDDLAIEARGVSITLRNRIEVPYALEGFANDDRTKPEDNVPGGIGVFRPVIDRKLPPDQQPAPFIVLQRIEIDGNHVAAWPPERWKANVGTISDTPESAQRLLALWIERAWRRPAKDTEQERFLAFYRKLRGDGLSFDEALRATFQSVLLSSPFRYLAPATDPLLVDHAVASKLSFMLWGAPPDEELRRVAAAGKLRDPRTLDAQVDRLVADPRSDAFFRPFVMQWLEMDQPITVVMDNIKKQDFRFGRNLKASMREETIRYIAQLFAGNRPAGELIASDWTLMNNILANHYGYDGIEGADFRRVVLRQDDPRGGGILGHAGIQSMLCWMGENWVIYRGAWALRRVLDDPPPAAPLEVPELIPSDKENQGKSFRELLLQHQADPNCTVCHRKMDPMGFAFQNFDLSGRWREVEYESYVKNEIDGKIEWRGNGHTRPVDTAGKLPRGEEFKTFAECRQLLVKHYTDDVVRGLLKNLVIYSTGRLPDVQDMAEIRTVMKEQQPSGYALRDTLKALLRSRVFLETPEPATGQRASLSPPPAASAPPRASETNQ